MKQKIKKHRRKLILSVLILFLIACFTLQSPLRTFNIRVRRALGISVSVCDPSVKPENTTCSLYFINVGQGDAVLLESGGHYCLMDTGPVDAREDLFNFLELEGVKSLDLMVLTHPHSDHTGNASAVLEQIKTAQVITGIDDNCSEEPSGAMKRAEETAGRKKIPWQEAGEGETYTVGDCTLTILSTGVTCENFNNASLIFRIVGPCFSYFCAGDAGMDEELDLEQRMPQNSFCDVYKLSHHGSNSSNSAGLLAKLSPRIAVASCGKNNSYGHPGSKALQRAEYAGARIWRTDENGTVAVFATPEGYYTACSGMEDQKQTEKREVLFAAA